MIPFNTEHESVSFCHDTRTGLKAIIAIHSTRLGPALGGTRIFNYPTEEEALKDVLNLSRAMTYKAAAADLPFGGGKGVILMQGDDPNRRSKLTAYCRFVNLFSGNFQTGEDLGITSEDVALMRESTPFIAYNPPGYPAHLEISSLTARGVLSGIKACVQQVFGSPELKDRHIAIQGTGKVGWKLASLLRNERARVTVADIRSEVLNRAVSDLGCEIATPEKILLLDADVISPCAAGDVITPTIVEKLQAPIVAGCANNPLSSPSVAELLHSRGILYAPDFVINAGGLISAMLEFELEDEPTVLARVDNIGTRLLQAFHAARSRNCSPLQIIQEQVDQKLAQ